MHAIRECRDLQVSAVRECRDLQPRIKNELAREEPFPLALYQTLTRFTIDLHHAFPLARGRSELERTTARVLTGTMNEYRLVRRQHQLRSQLFSNSEYEVVAA